MHGEDKERSQKMVRDRYRGLSEEEKKQGKRVCKK